MADLGSSGELEVDSTKMSDSMIGLARNFNVKGSISTKSCEIDQITKYGVSRNGGKLAVVINIKNFSNSTNRRIPSRKLTDVDESTITNMLEDILGFQVTTKHDLNTGELMELFLEMQSWNYKDVDALAVVFMSHGDNKSIYTADGTMLDIKCLLDCLKGNNCPGLAGKPKLVFINASTWEEAAEDVDDEGEDVIDGPVAEIESDTMQDQRVCIPIECDFIYVYSPVTFGHQKRGVVEQGNIFLRTLSEMCLKLYGDDLEFCDLLTRVNRLVAYSVSTTSTIPPRPCFFLSTLTKDLYLPARN